MSLIKKVFLKSPMFVKKILVNFEAVRRDSFRRWGDYESISNLSNGETPFIGNYKALQEKQFIDLMTYVKDNVPAYNDIKGITSLEEVSKLPVIKKEDLKLNVDYYLSKEVKKEKLYKGSTSGSTGKPLVFYKDKESIRYNYVYADKMYELVGFTQKDIKCRFSGVNLFEFNRKNPPFWVYISKYKQLQCSPYHLREKNFKEYIDAMIENKVTFGTGYAKAWLFLAEYVLKYNYITPKLKAIVTDSEGISDEQQDVIEKAFKCKVYQTYGLGEVGQIAFQCKHRNYHIIPQTAYVEVVDENYQPVKAEEVGQIIVTSLYSKKAPYIRYATGDLGALSYNTCKCDWVSPLISRITGRVDDYLLTKDGRKIGRLSHIMKPAIGVMNSQLIQTDLDNLLIRIIPDIDFNRRSMDMVIINAKNFLGDINISWEIVNELERTKNGKIRYVIRKF